MAVWNNTVTANAAETALSLPSDLAVLAGIPQGKVAHAANTAAILANTTANSYVTGLKVGIVPVSVEKKNSANLTSVAEGKKVPHVGWTLRKEGTGGRAGRVTYEVLVAGSGAVSQNNAANAGGTLFPVP